MAADDAEPDDRSTPTTDTSGRTRTGTAVRAGLAVVGILVGVVWTARIALDGSVASGVLLELLPPVALVYLSVRYLRTVTAASAGDR